MKQPSFLKSFVILLVASIIICSVATPVLHNQIRNTLFQLNLAGNKEQAERLATLVSIDLEKGEVPDKVLAKVQNMLENTPQSKEHFACIVADPNKVIAHPKPSNIGKDVTGWTLTSDVEEKTFTQAAGEGVAFGGIQTRLDGSQDISYQVPIDTKPWAVCVHTKLDLVDQQASTMIASFGLVSFPALFLIILISACLIGGNGKESKNNN